MDTKICTFFLRNIKNNNGIVIHVNIYDCGKRRCDKISVFLLEAGSVKNH